MGFNLERLKQAIIDASNEKQDFREACSEWFVLSQSQIPGSECVCGKENITECNVLKNMYNGNTISPIGSQCVKRFGNPELTAQVDRLGNLRRKKVKAVEYVKECMSNGISPSLDKKHRGLLESIIGEIDEWIDETVSQPFVKMSKDIARKAISTGRLTANQATQWWRLWNWNLKKHILENDILVKVDNTEVN